MNLRSWCSVDEIVTGNLVEAYDTTGRKILVQIGKFLLFPVNVFMAKSYSKILYIKSSKKDQKLYFDIDKHEVTPRVQLMQPTVSKEKLSENQTPYISTDDLKEATERIDENGWKLQLRSQQKSAKKMTQVETAKTTQPATKVSSYKNPDYRSLPTYEAYLRSKSPTQVEIKSEDEPVDLSKIHYLGEYEAHTMSSFIFKFLCMN